MSYSDGRGGGRPDTGQIIAGCFLVLMSLGLLLVGGGCTVVLIGIIFSEGAAGGFGEMVPLLLLSLATFGGGCVAIWFGVRLLMGKYSG